MTRDDTLKPCPFCETPLESIALDGAHRCRMCGAESGDNWNDRPIEDALRAQLAAALDDLETARNNAATWKAETFQNFNRAKEAEAELAAAQAREAKYREALEYYAGLLNYQIVTGVEPMPKEIPPNTPKWVRGWDDGAKARAALAEKLP